jgi:hypothetical protein
LYGEPKLWREEGLYYLYSFPVDEKAGKVNLIIGVDVAGDTGVVTHLQLEPDIKHEEGAGS